MTVKYCVQIVCEPHKHTHTQSLSLLGIKFSLIPWSSISHHLLLGAASRMPGSSREAEEPSLPVPEHQSAYSSSPPSHSSVLVHFKFGMELNNFDKTSAWHLWPLTPPPPRDRRRGSVAFCFGDGGGWMLSLGLTVGVALVPVGALVALTRRSTTKGDTGVEKETVASEPD